MNREELEREARQRLEAMDAGYVFELWEIWCNQTLPDKEVMVSELLDAAGNSSELLEELLADIKAKEQEIVRL